MLNTKIPDGGFKNGVAKFWFNNISEYRKLGIMTKLQIDSKNKTVHVELDLKGETAPIIVDARYTLTDERGKTLIELGNVQTSREWINVVLNQYAKHRSFSVTPLIASVL